MSETGIQCSAILIIEDDDEIRESLKELLELEGYTCDTASNGREGLERLKVCPRPCLILLDLMMPVMTGWEFLENQKEDIRIATIPVVIVSAAGDRAKSAAAAGYFKKPLDFDVMLDCVRQYCGKAA